MTAEGKRACVIGAGFGGLALAIRLQAAGVATTLIEARDKPGGYAYSWQRDGFTFDAGPSAIADPASLRALWELTGHDMAADVELLPVGPLCRLSWPDGTSFDWSDDLVAMRRQIARLDPADIAGYDAFLEYSQGVYRDGYVRLASEPFLDLASMAKAAPALVRHRAWQSVFHVVSKHIRHDKLRAALSFPTLLIGGNPMTASAIHALIHTLVQSGGLWWARGGTGRLVAGLARHFERLGGELRLHDPVVQVATTGSRVTGLETRSGWTDRFDAVARTPTSSTPTATSCAAAGAARRWPGGS
jgi:phytoene desaturase